VYEKCHDYVHTFWLTWNAWLIMIQLVIVKWDEIINNSNSWKNTEIKGIPTLTRQTGILKIWQYIFSGYILFWFLLITCFLLSILPQNFSVYGVTLNRITGYIMCSLIYRRNNTLKY